MKQVKRVFLLVADSLGVGEAPDAAAFGDTGANTLKTIEQSPFFAAPTLGTLGLFNLKNAAMPCPNAGGFWGRAAANPVGCYARLCERSAGKDTTIGHWELAGIESKTPLPVYPNGFPPQIIAALEQAFGRKILCNQPYSGTKVLEDYGARHLETGALIVYTSADSVLQIAAHEKLVAPEQLYAYCKAARQIMQGEHGVGRVIARPFVGEPGRFVRTANRHDFSLLPPEETLLTVLQKAKIPVTAVGKISDIFAGVGVDEAVRTRSNNAGMDETISKAQDEGFTGLCFVNLVEFDMLYGHRRDADGYAAAVTTLDGQLHRLMTLLGEDDLLMVTADHGCDPGFLQTTDHTREQIPCLIYGKGIRQGVNLGTRSSFADVGKTVADAFGVENALAGKSFWPQIAGI